MLFRSGYGLGYGFREEEEREERKKRRSSLCLRKREMWIVDKRKIKNIGAGFPGGAVVKNSPAKAGFEPWSGKIPHAAEQLTPSATTPEAHVPRAHAPQQERPPQ